MTAPREPNLVLRCRHHLGTTHCSKREEIGVRERKREKVKLKGVDF
jgi:hypothetical protein